MVVDTARPSSLVAAHTTPNVWTDCLPTGQGGTHARDSDAETTPQGRGDTVDHEQTADGRVATGGRRERNKRQVRAKLYEAAIALFAENGYEGTSIEAITTRADVARGTFFNHFHRKEDLIVEWGERRRARLRDCIEEVNMADGERDAEQRLSGCLVALGKMNENDGECTQAMIKAWVKAGYPLSEEPFTAELFADVVARGKACGEFSQDIDVAQVGNVLHDVYLGSLYRWCRSGADAQLQSELREITHLVLNGVKARCR
ncbi:TetR/AcrR family transcriptional regulator [Streptomyces sp. NBC_01306]|uniref:TetR/AcrR family transcriptional regulator n=1 Tax=Streptomyces sp. NBC_01306 TaxID=2903819 RepID=UPI002255DDEE|nr:TetR/AcrR family transcriptional regulator [Streptomyces sp. NBC_01306]MCX4723189.1 TetR/AcrR family transcriptional regulator [Streptomyces sp. NBC_01306]